MLYRVCIFALVLVMIVSCGKKKKKMVAEEDVNLQEYVDFFPEVRLPFTYGDTSLYARTDDSLLISSEIFNQFTPDSILKATFDGEAAKIYAIGKFIDFYFPDHSIIVHFWLEIYGT